MYFRELEDERYVAREGDANQGRGRGRARARGSKRKLGVMSWDKGLKNIGR